MGRSYTINIFVMVVKIQKENFGVSSSAMKGLYFSSSQLEKTRNL